MIEFNMNYANLPIWVRAAGFDDVELSKQAFDEGEL
jgi:hypothetical protein